MTLDTTDTQLVIDALASGAAALSWLMDDANQCEENRENFRQRRKMIDKAINIVINARCKLEVPNAND